MKIFYVTGLLSLLLTAANIYADENFAVVNATKVPPGMVYSQGGLVTVGPFAKDQINWGKREIFLAPYYIDINAVLKLDSDTCYTTRHGRYASIAELSSAMQSKAVAPVEKPEIVSDEVSLADPKEAEELAETEGAGFYEAYLTDGKEISMNLPYDDYRPDNWQGRCVVSTLPSSQPAVYHLNQNVPLRSGPGNSWTILVSPYHSSAIPMWVKKDEKIEFIYRDGEWAFIRLPNRSFDVNGTGWVPWQALQAHL